MGSKIREAASDRRNFMVYECPLKAEGCADRYRNLMTLPATKGQQSRPHAGSTLWTAYIVVAHGWGR